MRIRTTNIAVFSIIVGLFFLIEGCRNNPSNDRLDDLTTSIEESYMGFQKLQKDSTIINTPFYLFSNEIGDLTTNLLDLIKSENPDKNQLNHQLFVLKEKILTYNRCDSLIVLFSDLLKMPKDFSRKSYRTLECNLLKVQDLFTREMLNSAIEIDTEKDTIPYLIPISNSLYNNEHMEAYLIIPRPKITRLVFVSPDSLQYSVLNKNYLFLSGKLRNEIDSIIVRTVLNRTKTYSTTIDLIEYYEIK